ncbi:PP2C family protein-serine/threonine phosphatase (plasmid) [Streptomyces sp. BI20]|uniref:PP2C family protein-serine/threonine phosphatase n=1 Tax=Streptomyces sp. BI20 TaxID=3403460 RepID=UPI003C70F65B
MRVVTAQTGPVGEITRVCLLLVEDDAGDALLFEEVLADSGLDAVLTWCRSLAEAEAALAVPTDHPLCVLLDLGLPDANGLGALRRILDLAPDAAVVVLTGLAENRAGVAAVAEGAEDYLSKDQLDAERLDRAVRYALQRKQVQRANAALAAGRARARENARLERSLLPTPLLRDDSFSVVARYEPGRPQGIVGGDFHDVVQTPDGAVHAVVGDVSGHGPVEAALGVCLRVAWRAAVLSGRSGPDQMSLLEEMLVAERGREHLYATLVSLVFEPDRRTVRITRAGHPGLLLRADGEVVWHEPPGGLALGILPGEGGRVESILTLPSGASLLAFTDGLYEGRTGTDTRLGEEGLLAVARRHAHLNPEAFVSTLVSEVAAGAAPFGGLTDDIAVLHMSWENP